MIVSFVARGQFFDCSQHRLRMPFDFDLAPHTGNSAPAVDEESRTFNPFDQLAIHVLVLDDVVCLAHPAIDIGQQRERQSLQRFDKFRMRLQVVPTDPEHLRVQNGQFVVYPAKLAGLVRSTRCVVFGVKVQNHVLFAAKVCQPNFTLSPRQYELGGHTSYFHNCHANSSLICNFERIISQNMNNRIEAMEYIRGLAMLGVVAIHTGSMVLLDPAANPHLVALLEIASRFSVPIFFFISAFSLFRQYPLQQPLDLRRFFQRRFSRVLLPYVAGSILYMLHYSWLTGDWSIWFPILVYQFFFFGMGCYQLYFLVILLWFYLLMPLWRGWVRHILRQPLLWLALLLVAQIAFNYYSSYRLKPNFANFYLNLGIEYRMSWWPLHYVFLFLLGGVVASKYEQVFPLLQRHMRLLGGLLLICLTAMLAHYYVLIGPFHYTLVQAVNTVHQLSPAGVLYSVVASLYLLVRFARPLPIRLRQTLSIAGRYSYSIFWLHPFFLHYLHEAVRSMGWRLDAPVTAALYLATISVSLSTAILWQTIRSKQK